MQSSRIPEFFFEHDDQQRIIQRIDQVWDATLSRWQDQLRESSSYTTLTRTVKGDIYNSGTWQPTLISFTLFNEQFQPIEESTSLPGAQPLGRRFYTYNANGDLIEKLFQFFDPITETWQSNGLWVFDVDDDGDVLERRTLELNLFLQELVFVGRSIYTYSPAVDIAGRTYTHPRFAFALS